jgi:hypothetical protein
MSSSAIRTEALLMLEGKGAILDVARAVTATLEKGGVPGAVIGGVAVVLHGHVRTTMDVDVFVPDPLAAFAEQLSESGFKFDASKHEFNLNSVPVHLVTIEQTGFSPAQVIELEGIRTVSLADLINLKLASGTRSILRSQDIADVIGLIRANHLTGSFIAKVAEQWRKDFRTLIRAVADGK